VDADKQNKIKRIIPRRNNEVNKEWMCDHGRLSFPYVYENRMNLPTKNNQEIPWADAFRMAAEALGGNDVVFLVSLWTTLEGMEKIKSLAAEKGSPVFGFGNASTKDQVFPGFTIYGDKNPNRAGFTATFGDLKSPSASDLNGKTVFVFGNVPRFEIPADLAQSLSSASKLIVVDFARGSFANHAKTQQLFHRARSLTEIHQIALLVST
jgi:hypothetical protein